MNEKLKWSFFLLLLISTGAHSLNYDFCKLDVFFEKSKEHKNYEINIKNNEIEEKDNEISLLPSISINSGQYSSNKSGFNDVRKSSIGVSLSQEIYSGGAYFKNKEKSNLERKVINANLTSSRSEYLIDILRYISNYNYLKDQVSIYANKLISQEKLMLKHEGMFNNGRISYFDLSVNKLKVKELEVVIKNLKNEIDLNKKIFHHKYGLPESMIEQISLMDILNCKTQSGYELLKEKYNHEKNIANLNYEITKASLKPSVSLSLSMSPPNEGYIEDLRFSKAHYNVSVNVSTSLSNLLLKNTSLNKHLLDIQRINIERDDAISRYEQEVMIIKNEIKKLEDEVNYLVDDVKLKKDKLEYIYERYLNNKDTILFYYEQFELYQLAELKLKKKEQDLEYYKAYLYFIN